MSSGVSISVSLFTHKASPPGRHPPLTQGSLVTRGARREARSARGSLVTMVCTLVYGTEETGETRPGDLIPSSGHRSPDRGELLATVHNRLFLVL